MDILLCEDEVRIASFLIQGLSEDGHRVVHVENGAKAIQSITKQLFDVVLLDVRLPDMSGIVVCETIRLHKPNLPILMLTALDTTDDIVLGLKAGADDYLCKPFSFAELLARLEALHRRTKHFVQENIEDFGIQIDPIFKKCFFAGQDIPFTVREFELFSYLWAREGQIVSREMLYREVWKMPFEPSTNVVDVYVNYLRHKIKTYKIPLSIETLRGRGVCMTRDILHNHDEISSAENE